MSQVVVCIYIRSWMRFVVCTLYGNLFSYWYYYFYILRSPCYTSLNGKSEKKERKKEKMERGWLVYTGEGVRVKRGTNITDSNVQQRIYSILYSMYICIGEGGCYNNNRNTEKERRVYYIIVVASLLPWLISLWWIWRNTPCTFLFRLVYRVDNDFIFSIQFLYTPPWRRRRRRKKKKHISIWHIYLMCRGEEVKVLGKKWKEHVNNTFAIVGNQYIASRQRVRDFHEVTSTKSHWLTS